MTRVIMDTGPLVAWLCPKDAHHRWALAAFERLPAGCLTCEAVVGLTHGPHSGIFSSPHAKPLRLGRPWHPSS
jgi:hypothetical protein